MGTRVLDVVKEIIAIHLLILEPLHHHLSSLFSQQLPAIVMIIADITKQPTNQQTSLPVRYLYRYMSASQQI